MPNDDVEREITENEKAQLVTAALDVLEERVIAALGKSSPGVRLAAKLAITGLRLQLTRLLDERG